jgi:hypothetical protein
MGWRRCRRYLVWKIKEKTATFSMNIPGKPYACKKFIFASLIEIVLLHIREKRRKKVFNKIISILQRKVQNKVISILIV